MSSKITLNPSIQLKYFINARKVLFTLSLTHSFFFCPPTNSAQPPRLMDECRVAIFHS